MAHNWKGKTVTVLMGGQSHERPISLISGQHVAETLRTCGLKVTTFDVESDLLSLVTTLTTHRPDVVFNALHGPFGEDGHVQAVLDWLSLPYTYSGLTASAVAMDKVLTRNLLQAADLPVAAGKVISPEALAKNDPMTAQYVVKPVNNGSTFGISILKPGDNLREQIAQNWSYGDRILVEEYIPGRELTVGVLDDRALTVTEIVPLISHMPGFYDYQSKYKKGGSSHCLPAELPNSVLHKIMDMAVKVHSVIGCVGATRTDFRYDDTNGSDRLVILEINTQPGLTPTSLLPEQAHYCGLSYVDLCLWMLNHARCHV